jgi:hypothetical protein
MISFKVEAENDAGAHKSVSGRLEMKNRAFHAHKTASFS